MEEEKKDPKNDIIDDDLYEEFTDEELLELVEAARAESLQKAKENKEQRQKQKPKTRFPKWVFWLIAVALAFNVIALLPQTLSIPAIQFLKTSASLSTQPEIQAYKEAVVLIDTGDGKGTGFSYSDEGHILTNYHVIEGYDRVTVAFPDAGYFVGEVIETYEDIDLAVIQIDHDTALPSLDLAKSFTLKSGEAVYFIGNPLKFTGIANQGTIINYVDVASKELPVVMMDAPVYRGNSGSPVINESGKVIGVVFATLFHDEEGRVGLFIPIDYFYNARQQ